MNWAHLARCKDNYASLFIEQDAEGNVSDIGSHGWELVQVQWLPESELWVAFFKRQAPPTFFERGP